MLSCRTGETRFDNSCSFQLHSCRAARQGSSKIVFGPQGSKTCAVAALSFFSSHTRSERHIWTLVAQKSVQFSEVTNINDNSSHRVAATDILVEASSQTLSTAEPQRKSTPRMGRPSAISILVDD